jgi:sensor c-di-GMP phosphodiesterase-like protein
MIALGRSLGLTVVAEGVENQEQLDFLAAEGCHGAQGFLLAPPLPASDMAKLLRFDFMRRTGVSAPSKTETLDHRRWRTRATA